MSTIELSDGLKVTKGRWNKNKTLSELHRLGLDDLRIWNAGEEAQLTLTAASRQPFY
jgi:hypothetical protein